MAALGHGLHAVGAAWPHTLRPKRAALLTISAVFIVGVAWGASGLGSSMRAQFLTNSEKSRLAWEESARLDPEKWKKEREKEEKEQREREKREREQRERERKRQEKEEREKAEREKKELEQEKREQQQQQQQREHREAEFFQQQAREGQHQQANGEPRPPSSPLNAPSPIALSPATAIGPTDTVTPFLVVLLVNASIFFFTFFATYSEGRAWRWYAMSLFTAVLYLAGLFAFLNEDSSEALHTVVALLLKPLCEKLLPPLFRDLWAGLQLGLVQVVLVFTTVTWSWSRANAAVTRMQEVVEEQRRAEEAAKEEARALKSQLAKVSGDGEALHGLQQSDLEGLEATAQKNLKRIQTYIEDRRKRITEALKDGESDAAIPHAHTP